MVNYWQYIPDYAARYSSYDAMDRVWVHGQALDKTGFVHAHTDSGGVLPNTTLSTSVQEMQTMEMKSVSKVTQIIEAVKTSVRNRTARWLEYDEGARYHRCQLASNQALKELEQLKNGVRGESYKSSFYR